MIALDVNGKRHDVDVSGDMPLLWVLRENLGLTGTKFGCGLGQCGACTVHVDGVAVRSCMTTAQSAAGKKSRPSKGCRPTSSHPLQKAWVAEQVPQCGYCQSGQIMSAAALLAKTPQADRRADRHGDDRQHLPLRHLSAHPPRHPARGARLKEDAMTRHDTDESRGASS